MQFSPADNDMITVGIFIGNYPKTYRLNLILQSFHNPFRHQPRLQLNTQPRLKLLTQ